MKISICDILSQFHVDACKVKVLRLNSRNENTKNATADRFIPKNNDLAQFGSHLMFSTVLASLTLFWFYFLSVHIGHIFFSKKMVLINFNEAIQLLHLHLGGRGSFQCKRLHINVLIEHLVNKLVTKITRLLKIPVLLKTCSKTAILCH